MVPDKDFWVIRSDSLERMVYALVCFWESERHSYPVRSHRAARTLTRAVEALRPEFV